MLRPVFSAAFWLFMTVSSLALFPVALVIWALTLPFDRRKRVLHQFTCFWGSLYTWLNPAWRVSIVGRDKIRPDRTYVMVANHQSLLDILVLFRLFSHFKWVSKAENFRVPCIGWNMSLNGYIKLVRGKKESVLSMLRDCRRALEADNSLMIFPEGTRSPTGRLRAFKTGAFDLAIDCEQSILPIVLRGTFDALPKSGFVLQGRHDIRVEVLDELTCESFAGESSEALAERVRGLIAEQLAKS